MHNLRFLKGSCLEEVAYKIKCIDLCSIIFPDFILYKSRMCNWSEREGCITSHVLLLLKGVISWTGCPLRINHFPSRPLWLLFQEQYPVLSHCCDTYTLAEYVFFFHSTLILSLSALVCVSCRSTFLMWDEFVTPISPASHLLTDYIICAVFCQVQSTTALTSRTHFCLPKNLSKRSLNWEADKEMLKNKIPLRQDLEHQPTF